MSDSLNGKSKSKYARIMAALAEIESYAAGSTNTATQEPLYYYFVNLCQEIEDAATPWYVRLWQRYKASRPINDDEIPF